MTILFYILLSVFVFASALLCLVILIQESKSIGLGASFGGDAGESLFGTSTAEVLKKFTAYMALIFLGLCVLLSLLTSKLGRSTISLPQVEIDAPTSLL